MSSRNICCWMAKSPGDHSRPVMRGDILFPDNLAVQRHLAPQFVFVLPPTNQDFFVGSREGGSTLHAMHATVLNVFGMVILAVCLCFIWPASSNYLAWSSCHTSIAVAASSSPPAAPCRLQCHTCLILQSCLLPSKPCDPYVTCARQVYGLYFFPRGA